MYREKGTHEMFIRVNRSRKFLSVGLVTMKRGGIHPQLIQRLERLHDDVQHGQEHEYAQDDQQDCDACVAARGTGKDDLVISCS